MTVHSLVLMSLLVSPASHQVDAKTVVLRGTIEHADHLSHMLKVRLENSAGSRYFSVPLHTRIFLDGKASGMLFLKEGMVVDLHVLESDGIVIRVSGYHQTNPPPMSRIASGPFDDTDKILRLHPRPNPEMKFRVGENLRLAIPKFHLVPLAKTEGEMSKTWDQFAATVSDPKFSIAEPWPIAIVPLGTKAKVLKVTDGAYEIEVVEGRYQHWRVWVKKAWAYPADDAQAAKKAEEMAGIQRPSGDSKK